MREIPKGLNRLLEFRIINQVFLGVAAASQLNGYFR
jgi:hypothetical protein